MGKVSLGLWVEKVERKEAGEPRVTSQPGCRPGACGARAGPGALKPGINRSVPVAPTEDLFAGYCS